MYRSSRQGIYFYDDHFKSGFDEDFGEISDEAHFHYIAIGRLVRYPKSPFEEACAAAMMIGGKLTDPVLCLSGGLDSEAMALAFIAAGVRFSAAIMNIENGLNEYDICVAKNFCRKFAIKYQEINLPARQILQNSQHIEIAEKFRTLSPERALFIMFLQKIAGHPVLAGEIFRKETSGGSIQMCCPKDRDLAYWRYFVDCDIEGIPYFHYYTPELTLSFMANTSVSHPDKEKIDWKGRHSDFYEHKLQIYREAGFAVEDTDLRKQKWHGYEGLKIFFDSLHNSTEAYNNAFRRPLEENPIYDQNQILLIDEGDEIAREILGTDPL
jgi:hypothetical protein